MSKAKNGVKLSVVALAEAETVYTAAQSENRKKKKRRTKYSALLKKLTKLTAGSAIRVEHKLTDPKKIKCLRAGIATSIRRNFGNTGFSTHSANGALYITHRKPQPTARVPSVAEEAVAAAAQTPLPRFIHSTLDEVLARMRERAKEAQEQAMEAQLCPML